MFVFTCYLNFSTCKVNNNTLFWVFQLQSEASLFPTVTEIEACVTCFEHIERKIVFMTVLNVLWRSIYPCDYPITMIQIIVPIANSQKCEMYCRIWNFLIFRLHEFPRIFFQDYFENCPIDTHTGDATRTIATQTKLQEIWFDP